MKRAIVIAGLVLAALAIAAIASGRPVLFRVTPDPTELRPRYHCIMNPFRDRAPEHAAEQYLERLKSGDVVVIGPLVKDPEWREHLIATETKYPILSWRVGQRKDTPAETDLMYWVRRGNYGDHEEEVYFTVQRSRNGDARVLTFNAFY
jgi:hypothetical protein